MTHRNGPRAWVATAVALACAACGTSNGAVTTSAAATPVTLAFHIVLTDTQFGEGVTAKVNSPQFGRGTFAADIPTDTSDPGPYSNCNTVDETSTFTFPAGTIAYRSWHRDCNFSGPRIQTIFAITGGTGLYAGATGWGTEQDNPDGSDELVYDGTITYAATTETSTS